MNDRNFFLKELKKLEDHTLNDPDAQVWYAADCLSEIVRHTFDKINYSLVLMDNGGLPPVWYCFSTELVPSGRHILKVVSWKIL